MRRGVALGATGLETDVRLTRDGELVCTHDARVGLLRRPVAELTLAQLPPHVPTLRSVLTEPDFAGLPVSVDVKARPAWGALLDLAGELSVGSRLWCCGTVEDLRVVARAERGVGLVLSVPREQIMVADLGPAQVVNLRIGSWDTALLARIHASGRQALGWGLDGRAAEEARGLALGLDGIYGDDVPAMVRAAALAAG